MRLLQTLTTVATVYAQNSMVAMVTGVPWLLWLLEFHSCCGYWSSMVAVVTVTVELW